MKCMFCILLESMPAAQRALLEANVNDEVLRHFAIMTIEGIYNPDPTKLVNEFHRGILMTERCARVVEARCGACGQDTCILCDAAREIRRRSNELYADREREMMEETYDNLFNSLIESVCKLHTDFAEVLREEYVKKQTWAMALNLEKGK